MATATTGSKTIVVLELSEDEATALSAILRLVGGDPHTTRRGLMESIERALQTLGISDRPKDTEGSIYFKEVPGC